MTGVFRKGYHIFGAYSPVAIIFYHNRGIIVKGFNNDLKINLHDMQSVALLDMRKLRLRSICCYWARYATERLLDSKFSTCIKVVRFFKTPSYYFITPNTVILSESVRISKVRCLLFQCVALKVLG